MKIKLSLFTVLLSSICFCNAQDINFSQFYELPLLRNPALAGIYKGDLRITSVMRNQWNSVSVPYTSQAIGAETKFGISNNSNDYLSLGLQVTNDIAGDSRLGKIQLLPVLAYHKSLSQESNTYLTLGFMGGFVSQRFDHSKLKFDDQFVNGAYSPTNPTQNIFSKSQKTYADGSVGLSISSSLNDEINFYLGGAYFHFTKPRVAFNELNDIILNSKFVVNAGFSASTSEAGKIIFYLDYFTQGGNRQAQGGIMYKHDLLQQYEDESIYLSIGSFLRWNDAVMPVIKLDYYQFSLGLTYDVNISKLVPASQLRGGFELSMTYQNFLNIRNSSLKKTKCPVSLD